MSESVHYYLDIYNALNRMSGNQRKVFLSMMKTLAAHQDMWPV